MKEKKMSTLVAPKDFSPVADAEAIKKACQGWGTDERAIISVLGHRNIFQRRLIRLAYEEIYHEDLIGQLQSELSGHFERALCHWILDPADRDAVFANSALKRATPDHRVVIELACLKSPEELLGIRRAYKFRYRRSLEEDVAAHTTGDVRKILVALASAYRYDGNDIDKEMAKSEAGILRDEIHGNAFNHEELTRILSTRSKAQLNSTFNHYRDIHGTSITKGLSGDPANEYLEGLLRTAIRCIKDPRKYLAKVLRTAVNAVTTDKDALARVIVTCAEKDLAEIKELFLKRSSTSLEEAVANSTSGDFKEFLLTLLGSEDN
ncbi:annexin D8 [Rhodamnia argentea]|uniref:Annexin D8 n=1 Tax=Rhodamnia argentea TaxID=178133 RepID=A0A8B8NFD1_9MYRT|nr:annexin D8 [Rhodamnia argentea]